MQGGENMLELLLEDYDDYQISSLFSLTFHIVLFTFISTPGGAGQQAIRQAVNTVIQGSAADVVKAAMVITFNK